MKLPKRVRRQTSFFENSDDESSSPSPPARPAPGRTKQIATPQKKGSANKGTTPLAKPTPKKSHKKKAPESLKASESTHPAKVVPPSPSQEVVDTPKKGATPPPTASTPSPTTTSTNKLDPKKSSPPPPPSVSVDVEPTVSSLTQTAKPSSLPAHHPKPPTSVVVGVLPHVTWYSLQFLNVGVPFALSTNHCGVRFNDGSCILAAIPPQHASITKGDAKPTVGDEADAASPAGSGKKRPREGAADLPTTTAGGGISTTVIYINRHSHRFSVRPATTSSSSSFDSFAKLIVPSPLERKFMALMWCKDALANPHKRAQFGFLQGVPAMMRVSDDMVDLSSVMGGSAKVTDFPLPLYLSGVQVGTSTDGSSAMDASEGDSSGGDGVTFELSNRSDVYPNRCYYPSDDDDGD